MNAWTNKRSISAIAGFFAPVASIVAVVVQGVMQPNYSHVRLPISALAAWPCGWIQSLNFFVFGGLMIVFVTGLDRSMHRGHGGIVGPALLVVSGIGLLLAGIFPWRLADGEFFVPPGHLLGAAFAF